MRRRRVWPRADRLLALLLLWAVWVGAARAAEGDTLAAAAADLPVQRLVLAVSVDGRAAAEPVVVRREGPVLRMRAADLRALGIAVAGEPLDVALSDIPDLEVAIDERAQTLALTYRRSVQLVRVNDPPTAGAAVPMTRSDWGAAINYDLAATRVESRAAAGGLVDAVVYGPHGYFYAGAVVTTRPVAGQRRVTRLDTGFTSGDPGSGRRITVGDLITGATEQSRPVRLGGIQIARDFALRPDLVTFPVPAVSGTAAVPSAVDLILNGSRRAAGEVRAGQFAVTDLPVQSGVNTVTVAVRDALGRETRQTVSTYVARTLLRPGLIDFSLEAGWVRTGYATAADRYRNLAAGAVYRRGLTDRLTAETHVEAAGRVGVLTLGGSVGLGSAGLLSASAGVSRGHGGGAELAVGYERIGRPVSIAAHYLHHGGGWNDLASDGGAPTRDHLLSVNLGVDLGRIGTAGVTVIDQGRGRITRAVDGTALPVAGPTLPASTFLTATYSVRLFRGLNLVADAGRDFRIRRSAYLSVGALVVFGRRSSGYAGALVRDGGTSGTLDYSRTAIEPGDWGYHVSAAAGDIGRVAADVSYQGRAGYYAAQVERTNGVTAERISARGAFVISRVGVLPADRLTGAFAIVDTHGQGHVPIFRDNRRIGVTDRHGRMVVTNLPAYQPTRLSIDLLLLGDATVIDTAELWVRPAARTSVPVRFGLRQVRPVRVTLVDAAGKPIAPGSLARIDGGAELPVGMDGELYIEDLRAAAHVRIVARGGAACVATIALPPHVALLQRVGPVSCRPEQIAAD